MAFSEIISIFESRALFISNIEYNSQEMNNAHYIPCMRIFKLALDDTVNACSLKTFLS